jgi:FkbM family methyltransferase
MLQAIQCCTLVVDIGANKGQFTLAARNHMPGVKVIAFEPLPKPASRFRALFADDPCVTLHERAIGPERRVMTMHVSGREDSSSLLPIGELQETTFPGTGEVATVQVQVAPLSDFVQPYDVHNASLLKLDVQGFELHALHGCESLLGEFTHVYLECSFIELYVGQALVDEIVPWLAKRGFSLKGIYNLAHGKRGETVQADMLFNRDKTIAGVGA